MFRMDSIELNKGLIIDISSHEIYPTTIGGSQVYPFAYSDGVGIASSAFSILAQWTEADGKSAISDAVWSSFGSWRTDEQLASQEYAALKKIIEDNTVYVYGSLEEGGLFLYKNQNGDIKPAANYGFVFQVDSGVTKKRYLFQTTNRPISSTECSTVLLTTTEIIDGIEPTLCLWFYADEYRNGTVDPTTNYLWYADFNETLGDYNPVQTNSIVTAMSNPSWSVYVVNRIPDRLWSNAEKIADRLRYSFGGAPASGNVLSGNIFGNAGINPEGNPSYNGGLSGTGGGDGDFPDRSDSIDVTDLDDIDVDAVNSGFITLYNPTKTQVKSFSDFLWTDITDQLSTQIKRLIANPLDAVLFIAMCHFTPTTSGAQQIIKYCGISSGVGAKVISTQRQEIDCGTVTIPNASNSFLDYAPYSKASIYLPYVGIQQLDINDVMGSDINVVYLIDLLTGSATVQVHVERAKRNITANSQRGDTDIDAVLYEFTGSVYEHLPLTATDWRSAINNMTSLISGAVGVATGNGAGLGAMASAVASQQVSIQKSGSLSSNYGYVGHQKPYLILERPMDNTPADQGHYQGFPSHLHYKLENIIGSGFTIVEAGTWSADNINGTDAEMQEIKKYLESGVYI